MDRLSWYKSLLQLSCLGRRVGTALYSLRKFRRHAVVSYPLIGKQMTERMRFLQKEEANAKATRMSLLGFGCGSAEGVMLGGECYCEHLCHNGASFSVQTARQKQINLRTQHHHVRV
jgi:hypothetical protein